MEHKSSSCLRYLALHSDKAYQTLYAAYLIYAELILFYNIFNNHWQVNISAKLSSKPVKQMKGGTSCNICSENITIVLAPISEDEN